MHYIAKLDIFENFEMMKKERNLIVDNLNKQEECKRHKENHIIWFQNKKAHGRAFFYVLFIGDS